MEIFLSIFSNAASFLYSLLDLRKNVILIHLESARIFLGTILLFAIQYQNRISEKWYIILLYMANGVILI